jgi:Restriction endonuclease
MNWREYQEQTADLFRALDCIVEINALVSGARARHDVDVLVRFVRFGLVTTWVVECKFWKSPVTKEKVLVLREVVDDLGADRGVLVSEAGFQSGAVRAAQSTNITLTSLAEMRETARTDLSASLFQAMQTECTHLKYALMDLLEHRKTSTHSWTSQPRPGVNGDAILRAVGQLAVLEMGFDRVKLQRPPYLTKVDDGDGSRAYSANTVEEFLEAAASVIGDVRSVLSEQTQKLRAN